MDVRSLRVIHDGWCQEEEDEMSVTFREKYEWWLGQCGSPDDLHAPQSAEVIRLYDAAHPPEVTAEDVLREVGRMEFPQGSVHLTTGLVDFREDPEVGWAIAENLARREADRRRAAPKDDAWIERAAERATDRWWNAGEATQSQLVRIIREEMVR